MPLEGLGTIARASFIDMRVEISASYPAHIPAYLVRNLRN
jgi:hypothetical protein